MKPYILAETTWKTIKDMDVELAILPWGATEAHNYHLSYAADTIMVPLFFFVFDKIKIDTADKSYVERVKA
jgi:creatinine amidohydrolase/Fe(II)-dependent formamide hydrolase-like protein